MTELFGHLHPLLVHLPIGILLLGAFFDIQSSRVTGHVLAAAVRPTYFMGALSAVLACITGYWLAASDSYESEILEKHRWLGISTAGLSLLLAFRTSLPFVKKLSPRASSMTAIPLLTLIILTGHQGGTLTHGSGYLLTGLPEEWRKKIDSRSTDSVSIVIQDIQEARVYEDLAGQILRQKCGSCHGINKQKGGLRLDQASFIQAGGKHGPVLKNGSAGESELYRRLTLPLEDDKHMPPPEKEQLTTAELAILEWWISNGFDFHRKVKEIPQPEAIQPVLTGYQQGSGQESISASTDILPLEDVEPAPADKLQSLRSLNVIVMPIDPAKQYLRLNFQNVTANIDSVAVLMSGMEDRIVWLDLSGTLATDKVVDIIGKCSNLRKLNLSGTKVTDAGLSKLGSLQELKYLNLSKTKVTGNGIASLRGLNKLESLFVYQSMVTSADWENIRRMLPATRVDTGGYQMPILESDTTDVKEPSRKQ